MKRGISVTCTTCGLRKMPHGRSAPVYGGAYCGDLDFQGKICPGYKLDPKPGCLWPGETAEAFGYPCCDNATEEVSI